jgi:anti-anti-sigma factor
MQVEPENGVLVIKDIRTLDPASLRTLREALATAAQSHLPMIDLDLSQVNSVDAAALGVLAALHRSTRGRTPAVSAAVRLVNPQPGVRQMLELARIDRLFQIIQTPVKLNFAKNLPPLDLLEAA